MIKLGKLKQRTRNVKVVILKLVISLFDLVGCLGIFVERHAGCQLTGQVLRTKG